MNKRFQTLSCWASYLLSLVLFRADKGIVTARSHYPAGSVDMTCKNGTILRWAGAGSMVA